MVQEDVFKKHIELAAKLNKPLMLHVRASKGSDDAYYDALEILKTSPLTPLLEGEGNRTPKANFHFFSGSKECMEKIVSAGYTISVDGPITFSHDYDDMIRAVPLEKIMIETDAPFAAPAPYRGSASWRTCEPWMVIEVAKKIAELKNLDLETVRVQLLENAKQFFALDL
jgi:TatD DNase family protein